MPTAINYKRKIFDVRDLPTLPIIAQKILSLADDEDTRAGQLAELISKDQSLTVKVLSLANSAYYGHRSQVGTVKHAVVVIGSDMLKHLSVSVLAKALGHERQRLEFWRHSLLAAHASQSVGEKTGVPDPDLCFMGGLLHDVGKLVLDTRLPEEYLRVQEIVQTTHCELQEAEREVFQTDHAEVGAWMAERWQLPEVLVTAISAHHHDAPPPAPHTRFAATVHAGNVLARVRENMDRIPNEPVLWSLPVGIQQALKITDRQLNDVLNRLQDRQTAIDQFLV